MSGLIFEAEDSAGQSTLFAPNAHGAIAPVSLSGAYSGGLLPPTEAPLGGQNENIEGPDLLSSGGEVYVAGQSQGAGDDNGALGLFVYNPTTRTSQDVLNFAGSGMNSVPLNPNDFVAYNGAVYFDGDVFSPTLWVATKTASGTYEANAVDGAPGSPSSMATYDSQLFMDAIGADFKSDLFAYTAPASNTASGGAFQEIDAGLNPTDITAAKVGTHGIPDATFHDVSGQDLFMGGGAANHQSLYVYTESSSPEKVAATGSAASGLNPEDIVAMSSEYYVHGLEIEGQYLEVLKRNDAAYFSGAGSHGQRGLWESQGTTATEVAGTLGLDPYDLTALNGQLYFTGKDSAGGRGLFAFTPDGAGGQVTEILGNSHPVHNVGYDLTAGYNNNGGAQFGDLNPNTMTAHDGHLYFAASAAGGQNELYELTGTSAHPSVTLVSALGVNPSSLASF
jgi:hypothetical protein